MTPAEREESLAYPDAVHELAQLVPRAAVLSYGDVAELLGSGSARQAGKAMGAAPEGTPWWRILRSDGTITGALMAEASGHWAAEELASPGRRIDMNRKRWKPDPAQWERIDALRAALGNPKMSEADDQL